MPEQYQEDPNRASVWAAKATSGKGRWNDREVFVDMIRVGEGEGGRPTHRIYVRFKDEIKPGSDAPIYAYPIWTTERGISGSTHPDYFINVYPKEQVEGKRRPIFDIEFKSKAQAAGAPAATGDSALLGADGDVPF